MIVLKRILVTTDFSEFSEPAVAYGCAIAEKFDSELHMLHVCPDAAMLVPDVNGLGAAGLADQAATLEKAAGDQLQKLPPDNLTYHGTVIREVRIGSPFMEIIQYARKHDIDLIVIGTHGRTGLVHLLMGSVAENVVRKAPCPVLTVKPDGHQFVMP